MALDGCHIQNHDEIRQKLTMITTTRHDMPYCFTSTSHLSHWRKFNVRAWLPLHTIAFVRIPGPPFHIFFLSIYASFPFIAHKLGLLEFVSVVLFLHVLPAILRFTMPTCWPMPCLWSKHWYPPKIVFSQRSGNITADLALEYEIGSCSLLVRGRVWFIWCGPLFFFLFIWAWPSCHTDKLS